jgi:hypothetical protein
MTTPDEIDALMNVDSFSRIPECIVPGRTDRAETADHMARYRFAATRARGRAHVSQRSGWDSHQE